MMTSWALRKISARSRGLRPAQPSKADSAASMAALASSTEALATEAMVFSVAGSITSKRAQSDALRHLPPIHKSVGTLARRFSYMTEPFASRLNFQATAVSYRQFGLALAARCLPGYRRPAVEYAAW